MFGKQKKLIGKPKMVNEIKTKRLANKKGLLSQEQND